MACRTVTLLVQDFTGFSSAFSWAVGLVDPLLENARLVGTYPVVVGLEIVLKPRNCYQALAFLLDLVMDALFVSVPFISGWEELCTAARKTRIEIARILNRAAWQITGAHHQLCVSGSSVFHYSPMYQHSWFLTCMKIVLRDGEAITLFKSRG